MKKYPTWSGKLVKNIGTGQGAKDKDFKDHTRSSREYTSAELINRINRNKNVTTR